MIHAILDVLGSHVVGFVFLGVDMSQKFDLFHGA
jgi:hypothetical protein